MVIIVLDSNLLHGRAEPEAVTNLKPVLALAAQVKVGMAIPEACLIELREGMREKLVNAQEELSEAVGELKQLRVQAEAPPVDVDAALSQYEDRLQAFLRRHDIAVLPFPERVPDVRAFFDLAARKQPPFDASGNSYRDAIIALTVEECAQQGYAGVFFVTNDARFNQAFSSDKVECFKVEKMIEELEERLSAVQQRRRTKIRKGIAAVLTGRLGEITERASREVSFSPSLALGTRLLSIDGFAATKVDSVKPASTEGSPVDFTAKVAGKLSCTVEGRAYSVSALANALRHHGPRKVGEKAPESSFESSFTLSASDAIGELANGSVILHAPSIQSVELPVTLAIEGSATLDGGSVTSVSITKVSQEGPWLAFSF